MTYCAITIDFFHGDEYYARLPVRYNSLYFEIRVATVIDKASPVIFPGSVNVQPPSQTHNIENLPQC